jgi:hypothetical protein
LTKSQTWWFRPIITVLEKQRQENCKFKDSLSYIARLCVKKTKQEKVKLEKFGRDHLLTR